MSLPDRLRAAIAGAHTAIEATPLAAAMIGGTITRDAYAGWLAEMHHLHTALEAALADCPHAAGLYQPDEMTRSRLLDGDRAVFGGDEFGQPHPAVGELCGRFEEWRQSAPWKLLAPLYVLEGSRMGSMALLRPLAKAFGLAPQPGVGLDYHLDGIATRPQKWQQFRATLAGIPLTADQQEEVCSAAVTVMVGLCELYTAAAAVPVAA
jgi:heme oxygenase